MASKKFDDLDWDRSLDYEFEDPFAPVSQQKKRGVITRVATNFGAGVKDAFKTPATLRSMASNMLPKGYGTAINFGTDLTRQAEELHNIAMKELEPSLPAMRRITQRHLPKIKQFTPKSISDRFDQFSKPQNGNRGPSDAQMQEDSLRAAMADVFEVQAEASARQGAEEKVERALQHAQTTKQGRDQHRTLEVMQQGIMRLVDYQDSITNRFQRRSLELQTRSYLLARDQARVQMESTRRLHAQLEAIQINTSKPDIAKQDLRDTATQSFRDRMLGSAQNSAGRFAQNYVGNVFKRLQGTVRGAAGGIGNAAEMSEMGEDMPMLDMLMQAAGQMAVTGATKLGGRASRDFLSKKAPGGAQFGAKMHRLISAMPQYANRYARSPTKRDGMLGLGEEMLKDLLSTHTMDPTIGQSGIGQMDKRSSWTKQSQLTLVEIIPGFLSRIEHNTARMIDSTAERQVFNYDRRAFTNMAQAGDDMSNRMMPRESRAAVKQMVNKFIDDLIGDYPVSDDTRKGLFRQLLLDSGNGLPFDPDHYVSPASQTPELNARSKMELSKIFKSVGMLANGKRDEVWMADRSDSFHEINFGAVAPISAAGVYRSAGQRDILDRQGLITRDGFKDNLNMSKILDMLEEADYGDIKVKESSAADRMKDALGAKAKSTFNAGADLYKAGGVQAVLTAARLKAGAYRDQATGMVITKWEDIKGPVIDLTSQEVVLTAEDLVHDLVDNKGKKIRMSLRNTVNSAANWAQDMVKDNAPKAASKANEVKDVLNAKGEVLLSGVRLKMGKYRDAITKKVITKVEEIHGPIIDEDGITVVTASDVAKVMVDSGGKKLESAAVKMRARVESMTEQKTAPADENVFGGGSAADPAQVQGQTSMYMEQGDELIRLNTEQVELLKVIAEALMSQGDGGEGGEGESRRRRGFLDRIALGGIKGAWGGAKAAAKGTWWWTKKVGGFAGAGVGGAVSAAGSLVTGSARRIGSMWNKIKDIYVTGKSKPVLTSQRLAAKQFRDVNTKKVVIRVQDITGPVIDLSTGDTVIDQDDFDAGVYSKDASGVKRFAAKALGMLASGIGGVAMGAFALPFKVATLAFKAIGNALSWATNKQVDVYVKGESKPRLMAKKMEMGRYYNAGPKKTGKKVRGYSDIHGEIKELAAGSEKASADDKTVLYEEEISDPGLVNRWGMALKTPLARLVGAIGGVASSVVSGAAALYGGMMRGMGKLAGGMLGFGGGLLGAPFKFLGAILNPFEKSGKRQVELLEAIRDLLDARLPGGGPRKGSWQEQFMKRDEKKKEEKEKKEKDEKDKKWGVGGLLSFFKNKAKGLFGGGGDEEEEDDEDGGGGNTTIIGGGGGGDGKDKRARRSSGPAKTGGRFNRFRRNRAARRLRGQRAKGRAGGGAMPRMGRIGSPMAMAGMMAADPLMDAAGLEEDGVVRNGVGMGMNALGIASMFGMAKGALGLGGAAAATSAVGGTAVAAGGVGAAGAAGGVAATAVGGTAAVLGAPIWVPIAIGAAALAAVGAVGYYAYRQMKYGKPTASRRFRYLQYGLKPGDAGNNRKIFMLEELLVNHVSEEGGRVEIVSKSNSGGKAIAMENIYEIFDLTDGWFSNKGRERQMFNVWYNQRFKPIFLSWVAAVKAEEPTMSILEADEKLANEKMGKVLGKAWGMSKALYSIDAGPFEDMVTDVGQIEEAYLVASKEAGKSEEQKAKDKRTERLKTAAKWATGPVGALVASYFDNQSAEKKAEAEGLKLAEDKIAENTGETLLKASGGIRFTAAADSILTSPLSRSGKVTTLGALRYRAYGLNDLELDRVRALAALEAVVKSGISISDAGNVHMTQSSEEIYARVAGLFGLSASSNSDRQRWGIWFGQRFLPVFVAYIQQVRALAPSADLLQPERVLKADGQMQVGQAILNAKTDKGTSIWAITVSPWSSEERLLSDSNAVSGSLLFLKQQGEKQLAGEPTVAGRDAAVAQNKSFFQKMLDVNKSVNEKMSNWLLGDKDDRNMLGRAVDGVSNVMSNIGRGVTNAWSHASAGNYGAAASSVFGAATAGGRAAAGAMGFGPGLSHPGNGTGGDINSLPNIPSNEEIANMQPSQRFAALKPMFDAVASMTGVDPNMLYAICSIESTFNPNAKAPTSSASGLFQFINSTWAETLRRHGNKFGLSPSASQFDAKANALMGAMFLKDNFNYLKGRLNRGINETDMYMAHFMGPGGAADFLKRDFSANAAATFPKAANANKWIFYKQQRQGRRSVPDLSQPLSIGQVYELMQSKVQKAQDVYGGRQVTAASFDNVVAGSSAGGSSTNAAPGSATGGTSATAGVPDFSNVMGGILPNNQADTKAFSAVGAPRTTTTTANGPTGGVGGFDATIPAVAAATGGGYAGMTATASLSGQGPLAAAQPQLDSAGSLAASAEATAQNDALRQETIRQAEATAEQRRREVEVQNMRQGELETRQSNAMGEIMQRQLETQMEIKKNTGDTVSLLRDLLRKQSGTAEQSSAAQSPAVASKGPTVRPYESRNQTMPVDLRHQS